MKKDINYYKNKSIFITATNTDVGKTYASEKFLRFFAKNGLKVGYFKPCETGVIDFPLDGTKMLNLTKEGIVVQFLPEDKDFWVSLNQVLWQERQLITVCA